MEIALKRADFFTSETESNIERRGGDVPDARLAHGYGADCSGPYPMNELKSDILTIF
jgi:hypothetical protein